jgi:hypothetical protein
VGDQHALTVRGLRQLARAAVGEVDVDDERATRSLLVERRGLGQLLGPAPQRSQATAVTRCRQLDRVVDV